MKTTRDFNKLKEICKDRNIYLRHYNLWVPLAKNALNYIKPTNKVFFVYEFSGTNDIRISIQYVN